MPTITEICKGAPYCCPSCYSMVTVEEKRDLSHCHGITIECDCGHTDTFFEGEYDDVYPDEFIHINEHSIARNKDGIPMCYNCEKGAPMVEDSRCNMDNIHDAHLMMYVIGRLENTKCRKEKGILLNITTERFK